MTQAEVSRQPDWRDEFRVRLATSSHIVLAGATNEQHFLDGGGEGWAWLTTAEAVVSLLLEEGYSRVTTWTFGTGLVTVHPSEGGAAAAPTLEDNGAGILLEALRAAESPVSSPTSPVALLVTGAERLAETYAVSPLRDVIANAQAGARRLQPTPGNPKPNLIVWLTDREHDLPPWFLTTRGVHTLRIPLPELSDRLLIGRNVVLDFAGAAMLTAEERAERVKQLADLCDGMTRAQMRQVASFARAQGLDSTRVEDAVRGTRSGLGRSPWRDPDLGKQFASAREVLLGIRTPTPADTVEPVLGQPVAVEHALAVLDRAFLGLSDWDGALNSTRPRGVLFLAGPTGVGKTHLAKQIAAAVFGRPEAMARFDMSEYSESHSEARLIGSPPGYIGHEAGGQLTNAVRERPFRLLLFDEIDKADPRILDKFLQILEDGRLTDGAGSTVHFGETLIIFTSNLGIYERTADPRRLGRRLVEPGTPYEEVDRAVQAEVRRFFQVEIQRPEILNRLGENILVFDFLSQEAAIALLHRKLDGLEVTLAERHQIAVTITPEARSQLSELVVQPDHLANGGRGVKNVIEARVVNPLAGHLLRPDHPGSGRLSISGLTDHGLRVTW